MPRRLLITLAAVPLVALALFGVYLYYAEDPPPTAAFPPPRSPVLPDLGMPKLRDVTIEYSDAGTRRIFFTATIVNVGAGPFVLQAARANKRSLNWLVTQRFRERDGTTSERVTPGNMAWGGHGHNHWHVKVGASYTVESLAQPGVVLRKLVKAGYCFIDQERLAPYIAGSPVNPVYPRSTCGTRDDVAVSQGLSPGWADTYFWILPDQAVDITGLPDGLYRLRTDADPDDWFRESKENNNGTWVDFRLRTIAGGKPRIDILRYGPALRLVRPPKQPG